MAEQIVTYTPAERAVEIARTGRKVVEHAGVFFNEVGSGFYWPIDLLHAHDRFVRRIPGTRGHKMVVRMCDQANGFLNIMMAGEISTYDLGRFKKKRRWEIRKSLEQVDVQQLSKPEVMLEQNAHAVNQSFRERTRWGMALPSAEFAAALRNMMQDRGLRWFGAYVGERLAGYATLAVVNRHASIGHIATHTDYLPTGINGALLYEICRRCRESGVVDQIYFGLWSTKSSLNRFKERMLFKRRDLPAYVHLRWPINWGLRVLRPLVYRRTVGFSPDQFGKGDGGVCSEVGVS